MCMYACVYVCMHVSMYWFRNIHVHMCMSTCHWMRNKCKNMLKALLWVLGQAHGEAQSERLLAERDLENDIAATARCVLAVCRYYGCELCE